MVIHTIPKDTSLLEGVVLLGSKFSVLMQMLERKRCAGLGVVFVSYYVYHYLRVRPKDVRKISEMSDDEFMHSRILSDVLKFIVVRAHKVFSVFDGVSLQAHRSTAERLPYYAQLYDFVGEYVSGGRVLDVASGMHPLSLEYCSWRSAISYYTTLEVASSYADVYEQWFALQRNNGVLCCADTHYVTHIAKYVDAVCAVCTDMYDVVWALKAFDTLESQERHCSIKLLSGLSWNYVVASFNVQTIGRKAMERQEAGWFVRVVRQLSAHIVATKQFGDELVYIVRR